MCEAEEASSLTDGASEVVATGAIDFHIGEIAKVPTAVELGLVPIVDEASDPAGICSVCPKRFIAAETAGDSLYLAMGKASKGCSC